MRRTRQRKRPWRKRLSEAATKGERVSRYLGAVHVRPEEQRHFCDDGHQRCALVDGGPCPVRLRAERQVQHVVVVNLEGRGFRILVSYDGEAWWMHGKESMPDGDAARRVYALRDACPGLVLRTHVDAEGRLPADLVGPRTRMLARR